MKRIISVLTAAVVASALCVPVYAAGSPSTANVMKRQVTVSATVAAAKGYTLTTAEEAYVATTPEMAVALAAAGVVDASAGVLSGITTPELIAMAKLDLMKNPTLLQAIGQIKGTGAIISSSVLSYPDGHTGEKRINVTVAGTTPGEKVLVLFYNPGDPTPRFIKTTVRKNGKIRARLPIPCIYNIVK